MESGPKILFNNQELAKTSPQPFYSFWRGEWASTTPNDAKNPAPDPESIRQLYVLTWRIGRRYDDQIIGVMAALKMEMEVKVKCNPTAGTVIDLQILTKNHTSVK